VHVPPQSLRGLGWFNAPNIDLPGVSVFAPGASWCEPPVLQRQRELGKHIWLMPDRPPFSPSLAPESRAVDPVLLPWLAYRYRMNSIWIENAAPLPTGEGSPGTPGDALVYPGAPFGLLDQPVPSTRLKRLRRGLADHELLVMLAASGRELLAQRLAEQVVPYACTDACDSDILDTQPAGWIGNADDLSLARRLVLSEVAARTEPGRDESGTRVAASEAEWSRVMSQRQSLALDVRGVRLDPQPDGLAAVVYASGVNRTGRQISGSWQLPKPPAGWQQNGPSPMSFPSGARREEAVRLSLASLAYNDVGIYPFELEFQSDQAAAMVVAARIAVTSAPLTQRAPHIDGDLSDWGAGPANTAGDFLLCRGRTDERDKPASRRPTLDTRAHFSRDRQHLYVALRCSLKTGEAPAVRADNDVPVDGAVPWGQDVVEILIDPRPAADGPIGDLLVLQIKPNGTLIARRGPRTEPPTGPSVEWRSGARVSIGEGENAWTAEVAIPLGAIGLGRLGNQVLGVNITRLDSRRGEYSSWSGARGRCYDPAALGNLVVAD
jgi:hypothetical protein